ncbi:hypothetical protein [Polaribacter sp.]|uniref:hypothetical protein n=1 Tax=Polaribacter sp. TaxID=1920175 RepID=UPI003F4AB46B
MDSTQDLLGKVKKMNINILRYSEYENLNKENQVIYYDKKNKIIKETINHPNFKEETVFNYENKLLKSSLTKIGERLMKSEYKYDSNKNIIELNQFENDTLYFSKITKFDKNNNPLKSIYLHPNHKINNKKIEIFTYNYKKNEVVIQRFNEFNKPNNHYLKFYFDKNGFTLKTASFRNNSIIYSSKTAYDKDGNLTKRINFNKDKEVKESMEYMNKYDEKGNIILREVFLNGKLYEKTTYDITYY